ANLTPSERAAIVEVTGCGMAGDTRGSGIGIGEDLVVVPAHLVLQAAVVEVNVLGVPHPATVVVLDRPKDLALLHVDGVSFGAIEYGALAAGDRATLIGGSNSGSLPVRVLDRVTLTIEEALGTDRYDRLGYQLEVEASRGDSGAGIYDSSDRLVGMLFAVQGDTGVGWATAAEEIATLLATERSMYECDEQNSFIAESGA
ncbi:MAG: trypsin-like peptidase domain-containing protein, partial [Acidimicrobiia bacterium]|nr:trypsin-like peptidase domain-containing protein [Acidimicrobiia bacterium]